MSKKSDKKEKKEKKPRMAIAKLFAFHANVKVDVRYKKFAMYLVKAT